MTKIYQFFSQFNQNQQERPFQLIEPIKCMHQLFPWLELLSKFLPYLQFHSIKSTFKICDVEKY